MNRVKLPSMKYQVLERLNSMSAIGQSRHKAKLNGDANQKIFSHGTMKIYKDVGIDFAQWAKETHGCRLLDDAKQYTGEYLQTRIDAGKAPSTIKQEAAALTKLFQLYGDKGERISYEQKFGVELPQRHLNEFTQHRSGGATWQGRFSEKKNQDLINLCNGTGLRRCEVMKLTIDQLVEKDGKLILHNIKGKGGRIRDVAIRPEFVATVQEIFAKAAARAAAEDEGKDSRLVITNVVKRAPCHEFRRNYAQEEYARLAQPVENLEPKEQYTTMDGITLDRDAMKEVSESLGHSREDVIMSYLK